MVVVVVTQLLIPQHPGKRGARPACGLGLSTAPRLCFPTLAFFDPLLPQAVSMPEVLYEEVLEVEERVVLYRGEPDAGTPVKGEPCVCVQVLGLPQPLHTSELVALGSLVGRTGDLLEVQQPVDLRSLRGKLEGLLSRGIRSLAIVLMHSYT